MIAVIRDDIATVMVKKEDYDTLGHLSIFGFLSSKLSKRQTKLSKVIISFEETPMEWRKNNVGADSIVVPEFMPRCLINDVFHIMEIFKVKVEVTSH